MGFLDWLFGGNKREEEKYTYREISPEFFDSEEIDSEEYDSEEYYDSDQNIAEDMAQDYERFSENF